MDGKLKQQIIHRQERPTYEKKHIIDIEKPVQRKIFVIDDGTYCTMLLSHEY
ncbi:DUF960 family protein [Natronincola peptidivorans]|uniref:DUF960 family protein n=1 Tax=Natronincola peptidivorans TaxID=426128 RepID=UPI000B86FD44